MTELFDSALGNRFGSLWDSDDLRDSLKLLYAQHKPSRMKLSKRLSAGLAGFSNDTYATCVIHGKEISWILSDPTHFEVLTTGLWYGGEIQTDHATDEYCVELTYRTVDVYLALAPAEAVRRLVSLQGRINNAQEYMTRCIGQLVPKLIAAPASRGSQLAYAWINEAIDLANRGDVERSLDVIFDNIDEMLLSSKFDECSKLLEFLAVDRFTNEQLLTILTATLPAKALLPARAAFLAKVTTTISERGAEAADLLVGLD